MPGIRLTLQHRITSLIVISSVVFISVFTFVQLNNQLTSISRYNIDHAKISNIIVKNNIEGILKKAEDDALIQARAIQTSLSTLKEAEVIHEAVVFDKRGTIIASTNPQLVDQPVRFRDLNKFDILNAALKDNKWFVSEIDKLTHTLFLFLAIRHPSQEICSFIVKITYPLGNVQEAFLQVFKPVIISTIIIIVLNILLGYILSKNVIGPIRLLNQVTKLIAQGNLAIRTEIRTRDELQELGETFNIMTEELIKMKERAENANPLTKLPGNIVIHDEIEKRIKNNRTFMVIYCDLDNFKAFNDKYGIGKGDEAIKLTAAIFKEAAKQKGSPGDFVGHEGGDDFVLLTNPETAQAVADYITSEFDKQIRALYTAEDLEQGCILAHSRDGQIKRFPIMTISLAGVTNAHRTITSYAEVTNIAAEMKKKAKSIDGSKFVVDKRQS
ncbi:MAG: GGDEF domain-containing protein [Candidatus Omnitrophica bacterium]|nr:GGDEF domain-containing protein [Candidatus Omnitrophota bacterium]